MYLLAIFLHKYYMKFSCPIRKYRMIYCNTTIFFYCKSYLIYTSCINININSNINIAIYISELIYQSLHRHKKTGCITGIHPVFELSQARGEVINILLINTGTVYVALSFRFVVNANTFCFMTIIVSTRNTVNTEVVKTDIL